jgi:release factor glutamine methyltransferase
MPTIAQLEEHWQKTPDVDLVLAYALQRDRGFVLAYPDYRLTWREYARFIRAAWRRHRGWPLAYCLGYKEFYGRTFLVNRHTLIPRPETELMVDEVVKTIHALQTTPEPLTLIDIGTGTGCIPLTILQEIAYRQPITTFATDISRRALQVAQRNAGQHRTPISFLHGNLLEPFKKIPKTTSPLLLTANLPYLTAEQRATEPSIWCEPYNALVAKDGGLFYYKQLLRELVESPFFGDRPLFFFFEIYPSQSADLAAYVMTRLPAARVKIIKDLAGHDRLLTGELPA